MTRWLRRSIVVAALVGVGLGAAIAYGKHCIERGARWRGFALDSGVALVLG